MVERIVQYTNRPFLQARISINKSHAVSGRDSLSWSLKVCRDSSRKFLQAHDSFDIYYAVPE